jgi:Arc/MetJ-type ribon-helix-helix transcriptional regulator
MSPRRRLFNFAIDDDLAAGLKAIKARTGVSESEQVRRAIQMWLESQGEIKKKTARKRATSRQHS